MLFMKDWYLLWCIAVEWLLSPLIHALIWRTSPDPLCFTDKIGCIILTLIMSFWEQFHHTFHIDFYTSFFLSYCQSISALFEAMAWKLWNKISFFPVCEHCGFCEDSHVHEDRSSIFCDIRSCPLNIPTKKTITRDSVLSLGFSKMQRILEVSLITMQSEQSNSI